MRLAIRAFFAILAKVTFPRSEVFNCLTCFLPRYLCWHSGAGQRTQISTCYGNEENQPISLYRNDRMFSGLAHSLLAPGTGIRPF